MESHIKVDEGQLHILYVNLHIVVHLGKKLQQESQCHYANDQKFINAAVHEEKVIQCTFSETRNAVNKETKF